MGRSKTTGIYRSASGKYNVDAYYKKQRIRKSGFADYQEAQEYLIQQKTYIGQISTAGSRAAVSLEQAAIKYIEHKSERRLPSVTTDIYILKSLLEYCGSLTLDQINNDTLRPFIKWRKSQGLKTKSINSALSIVRRICVLAASEWRFPNGMTWLHSVPAITLLDQNDQRPPRPITWSEQNRLIAELPAHLKSVALFILNTGLRSNVVCQLAWEWEAKIQLDGLKISVFVIPRRYVKGRKQERVVICNSVAQEVLEQQRGLHAGRVFTYYRQTKTPSKVPVYRPINSILNTAWQSACERADLSDLYVHDLRHTVGMRLRLAGIPERTQDEILWHSKHDMTSHYAVAQVREIYQALEAIKEEGKFEKSLNLLALVRRTQMKSIQDDGFKIPQKSPLHKKTA